MNMKIKSKEILISTSFRFIQMKKSLEYRTQFIKMIKDTKKVKIDLILTKSISGFDRNTTGIVNFVIKLNKTRSFH